MAAGRRVVLLVDDDRAIATMYRLGLEQRGFVVNVADSGEAALAAIEMRVPDVAVLDWQMPGMRGDQLLMLLRQNEQTRDLPVLMLSNYPGTEGRVIDVVFAAGALAWLEKVTTTPAQLAERLAQALEGEGRPPPR